MYNVFPVKFDMIQTDFWFLNTWVTYDQGFQIQHVQSGNVF